MDIATYKDFFANKRITLMGLGLLGRGVGDAAFLAPLCRELVVTDLKSAEELATSLEQLKEFSNITYVLGEHRVEDFSGADMVIKAAGVPLDSIYIQAARDAGVPVYMSTALFAKFAPAAGATLVGITGTRGKSTVTHMIHHVLLQAGRRVHLGGNVRGLSTLSLLPEVAAGDVAVLELDSWQLQGFGEMGVSPHVAVFTTFMQDHMNYYGSMEKYFADKANIFISQSPEDYLIVGRQMAPLLEEYGYKDKARAHMVVVGDKDLPEQWSLVVPGEHNRYNAALAAAAARTLGVDTQVVHTALESFKGVPGRLERIREVRGVALYNDTTATSPDAALAALRTLGSDKKNIILIMGGTDKGFDTDELMALLPRYCKKVVLLGGTGTERILAQVREHYGDTAVYQTMHEAVSDAYAAAKEGDIVLMSPAFSSKGIFVNEYDRGDQFVAAVKNLT